MREFLHAAYWVSAGVIIYVYLVYPLFLFLLARYFPKLETPGELGEPTVSLVISAYNERTVMRAKLANALSLDYPKQSLQIVVVSDCSDDGTDDIVRDFAAKGALLVRQEERLGKSAGLNLAIPRCTGSIVVFSDANAIYAPDSIRALVKHFADATVGYVVGNARYVEDQGAAPSAKSEGLYWKLETWLKKNESRFGSVVGGDGAIYAIRKQLYSPLRPTDINDLLNPLQIILKGFRGIYEQEAICTEEAGDSFQKEFRRKVRIVGRSLNAVRRAPGTLLPWNSPRHWFALVSHKLLRWFVPVFLLVLLLASLASMDSMIFRLMVFFQAGFYVLATIGWIASSRKHCPRVIYVPYYFCLVNLASLIGTIQFFRGSLSPVWTTIRADGSGAPNASPSLRQRQP